MTRRFRFRLVASLVSVALLLTSAALVVAGSQGDEDTMSLQGKVAPDFSFKTLDGQTVKLSEQKGSVVLMDYWATWCPPCRKGLPHINELANDKDLAAKGLKVWAINSKEQEDKVKSFVKQNSFSFVVPMDTEGQFGKDYLVQGIPTTVVVGRDGTIKKVFIGFGAGQEKAIKQAVSDALNDKKST